MTFLKIARLFISIDVYYISIGQTSGITQKHIDALETRRIFWIKKYYKKFSEYEKGRFIARAFTDEVFEKVLKSHVLLEIQKYFGKNDDHIKKFETLWRRNIYLFLENLGFQHAAAEFLRENENYERVYVLSFCSLTKFLKANFFKECKLVTVPFFGFLLDIYPFFKAIIKRIVLRRKKKEKSSEQDQNVLSSSTNDSISDYEVVYFPHQGIFYGDLFTKDHYYTENENSLLHKSKILHISLGEKDEEYMEGSYHYYSKNHIPYMDLYDLQVPKKHILKSMISLLFRMNLKIVIDVYIFGASFIVMVFKVLLKLQFYLQSLIQFKKLKVALVGYDYLFPLELSLALSIKDIITCATQERFILSFFKDAFYIFDYYFVAGKEVYERGCKGSAIQHAIPVGLVRVDHLYYYEKEKIYDPKYDEIKKDKRLILALDYHLPNNEMENISRSSAKIDETRGFYLNLIRLAMDFSSIHIVIKGKDLDSYSSPYVNDIMNEIESIPNIEVEKDLSRYNPYYISEKADLTIACHTSLCDELLAAKRKVIFFEYSDRLETLFDYDNLPIIVHEYEELKNAVSKFLEGNYLEEERINELAGLFSYCYHGKVREIVQHHIVNNIESKRNRKGTLYAQ